VEVAAEVRGPSRARSVTGLPPGRGRGSSVSSIVCYLVGLSHIDPIRNRLRIDRFLTEGMRSLPDIDLDFPRDIRARLIERVYERWGRDHAALVAIFPTYRLRSAVRDVGKVLGLPEAEVDRLAKRSKPYDHATEVGTEVTRQRQPRRVADGSAFADTTLAEAVAASEDRSWRLLAEVSSQLAGFPRHLSQHVGGMVAPPALIDPLDQPRPDVAREVEVDVRQRLHPLGEKAVDAQPGTDRVNVGEPDQVADDRGDR